jgi:CRP/FNR family transcriptional regulator, cyclic AMP receptor protein
MSAQPAQTSAAPHPFLQGVGERIAAQLAAVAKPFSAKPGEVFARQGEAAEAFFLIQAGHVALDLYTPNRGAVPIQTVGPGECVGWSWLVPPNRWQFDCRAVDRVSGLVFDAAWLRKRCEEDHELGYQLLRQLVIVMGNRLAATRFQLLDVYK